MPLLLRVSAGPSHTELIHISPNNDTNPIQISSNCFSGELRVRILNFSGLHPRTSPFYGQRTTSPYFQQNSSCTYSIDLRGKFTVSGISFDDLVFGNVFEKKLRLPPGAGLAVSVIKKWIDPGLECDIYSDKPWARSPVIVTMNEVVEVQDGDEEANRLMKPSEPWKPLKERHRIRKIDGSVISDAKQRKKYFSSSAARHGRDYAVDRMYGFDFCNGMADFNEFAVRIPGWGYQSVLPFWDGQSLKYVMETKDRKYTVFVLVFELVEMSLDEEVDVDDVAMDSKDDVEAETNIAESSQKEADVASSTSTSPSSSSSEMSSTADRGDSSDQSARRHTRKRRIGTLPSSPFTQAQPQNSHSNWQDVD